jgi:CHAT domain-containing protein
MGRFYGALFKHQSAAAALRHLQIEMWRQQDWRSLYYRAAFAVHGVWRPLAPRPH